MTELDMHVKAEALVVSVRHGQLACARALLREGCDPCLKHAGRTALYWAVRLDHAPMLYLLLDDLLLLLDDGICLPQPRTSQLHRLHLPATQPDVVDVPRQRREESMADEVFTDADDVLEKRALFPDSMSEYGGSSVMDSPSEAPAPISEANNQAGRADNLTASVTKNCKPKEQTPPRRSKEEKMRARAQRAINEALFEAASHGSSKCIEILLASHADPNAYFYHDDEFLSWSTPLLAACFAPVYCQQRSEGHEERYLAVVESLVGHGADIGKANCFGDTALHWAAVSAMRPVVLLLLRNGADINRQNSYGRTPLVCCLEHNTDDVHAVADDIHAVCRLLVQWGASLDIQDKDGWTALHYAVERKKITSATLLLESGACVDSSSTGRMNPLDIAVTTENIELVRLLLRWDARVTRSCVQLSVETHNVDILERLVLAGGHRGLTGAVEIWSASPEISKDAVERLQLIVSSPLSLKHCTRLKLREVVKRGDVGQLPLPLLLKDYLLFSDL